jgi:cytochrome b
VTPGQGEVPVWSRFVRVFHWSLVSTVALAWITTEIGQPLHEPIGWAMVALLVLRLLWGLAGSEHAARFGSFVRGPRAVLAYARDVIARRAPRYLGHNPLGGWMVLSLMLTLALVAVSGWLMTTDAFWGSEIMEELHEGLAEALLVLVALHVAGVFYTGWHQRENLVRAMLSGRKRTPAPGDVEA